MSTWGQLRKGMWIICPHTGHPERVIAARKVTGERWIIRTENHEHVRTGSLPVEVAS